MALELINVMISRPWAGRCGKPDHWPHLQRGQRDPLVVLRQICLTSFEPMPEWCYASDTACWEPGCSVETASRVDIRAHPGGQPRMIFIDRADAGRQLAARLRHLYNRDVVVLGLPRGGVPVAAKVAEQLGAQLDVLLVRKLGVPFQPELAMGAVGEGGILILDHHTIRRARVTEAQLVAAQERERAELQRRINRYRPGRLSVALAGRTAVIVDDGLATGSTAQAACQVARAHNAQHVVLAVPVAPLGWERRFPAVADDLVCVASPQPFSSIGCSYHDFRQISDPEVLACLDRAREEHKPD